jgi:hypothetical protein
MLQSRALHTETLKLDQNDINTTLTNLDLLDTLRGRRIIDEEEYEDFRAAIMAGFRANCENPQHNHGKETVEE